MSSEQEDRLLGFIIHQLEFCGSNVDHAWSVITENSFGSLEETIAALKFILSSPTTKIKTKGYAKALLNKFYELRFD